MENNEKSEGISLGDLFRILWKNIILLIIITMTIIALGTVYTYAAVKPKYKSTASVIVSIMQGSTIDYVNSLRVAGSVAQLVKEDIVLNEVADSLNVESEEKEDFVRKLKSNIDVTSSSSSYIVSISVTLTDKDKTKVLTNEIAQSLIKVINDPNNDSLTFLRNSVSLTTPAKEGTYVSPNKILYIAISLFAGLIVSVSVIFVKELFSNKFKNKADVEAIYKENIIGIFYDNKKLDNTVSLITPNIRECEPYNRLAMNIKYLNVDNPYKVLMITSTEPNEIKSTTICNLAYTLALNNKKVLLIDLDIRKPSVHKYFNISTEVGLIDYIDGNLDAKSIIKHTDESVDIITAGKKVLNPLVIVESQKLQSLIDELRKEYDYILIDTPPVLACADAIAISKKSDGVIFNIALNTTKKVLVKEAYNNLKNAKANIIGINLTKAPLGRGEIQYYNSYYEEEE